MPKQRPQSREKFTTITFTLTYDQKREWNAQAARRGLSASAFFVFVIEHLRGELAFFVDRAAAGSIFDHLVETLKSSCRRAAREEARLVLIEKGFDTEPYDG